MITTLERIMEVKSTLHVGKASDFSWISLKSHLEVRGGNRKEFTLRMLLDLLERE
jgi:hypothetical protein